jgi:hypothetical protein
VTRYLRWWWVVLVALSAVFASYGVENAETMYPLGSTYAVYADFSSSTLSKQQVVKDLAARAPCTSSGEFLLTKANSEDAVNGLDVYRFGGRSAGHSAVVWFKNARHGRVLPASDLGLLNLSGNYSFYDGASAQGFVQTVARLGGSTQAVTHRSPVSVFAGALGANRGASLLALAVLFLNIAVLWAWSGSRRRSRSVRFMYGRTTASLQSEDILLFCRLSLPAIAGGFLIGGCMAAYHRFHDVVLFFTVFLSLVAAHVVFSLIAASLFLLLFTPSVRQLAARVGKSTLVRWGNGTWKYLCLVTVLMALPLSVSSASLASQSRAAASQWGNASNAVTFSVQGNGDYQSYVGRFRRFFTTTDSDGTLALSYSVAPMMIDGTGSDARPSQSLIERQLAPYDDVIVTNPTFLDLMKVNRRLMKPVDGTALPQTVRRGLSDYQSIWFTSASASASYRLYTWSAGAGFPALDYTSNPGEMSNTRHPLILLVDEPARSMNLENFLIPSMTTGNVIFTDLARTRRALDASALTPVVYSASTVSDAALYRAQLLEGNAVADIMAAILAILAGVFCAVQSSWIWAVEHRSLIFIRHTDGTAYARLLSRRLLLHTLLEMTLTGVAYVALYYGLLLPEQAPVAVAVGILFIALEWVSAFISCRRVFKSSVQRQSI